MGRWMRWRSSKLVVTGFAFLGPFPSFWMLRGSHVGILE